MFQKEGGKGRENRSLLSPTNRPGIIRLQAPETPSRGAVTYSEPRLCRTVPAAAWNRLRPRLLRHSLRQGRFTASLCRHRGPPLMTPSPPTYLSDCPRGHDMAQQ